MNKNYLLSIIAFLTIFLDSTIIFAENENLISNTENTESINAEAVNEAQQGNYEPAIKKFKNIVSLQDKNSASMYNNLGYALLLKGDYQNALENFQKAVDRNPALIPAIANLGKMLFKQGQYLEAIKYGEKTLALDPQNTNVREWLPDAYKKAADKRMFDLQNSKKEEAKTEEKNQDNTNKLISKKPASRLEINGIYELLLDKTTNTPQPHTANNILTFPAGMVADIWASPEVEIYGELKTPNPGIYIPYFITSEENISFMMHNKQFFYGMGIYFSQANFDYTKVSGESAFIHNSSYPKRNDIKLGFSLGYQQEFSSLTFYTYPRYLFQDMLVGPQSIEYDRSITKIEYRMVLPEDAKRPIIPLHFEFGVGFKTNEFFITEYNINSTSTTVGHYFGAYDLYLDFAFGKIQPVFDKVPMQFGFILGSRLYFQDFDETSPFPVIGYGQGFFGFDWRSILLTAGPFPTYKTISYLTDIYSRQMFFSKLVLMEKIGAEFTGAGALYNGFSVALSAAYTF